MVRLDLPLVRSDSPAVLHAVFLRIGNTEVLPVEPVPSQEETFQPGGEERIAGIPAPFRVRSLAWVNRWW
jgi:hypothetical protein